MKDETLRSRDWPIAIIEAVHEGDDREVRAATLRCHGKTYRRPSNMLIPFQADQEHPQAPSLPPPGSMSGTSSPSQDSAQSE